jgi:hypothetical protein
MLVIVCVLFLVTELPQGAILLLTFLSKDNSKYYYQIYQQLGIFDFLFFDKIKLFFFLFFLGDTFDILALINNSVNFTLYCLMSRAFRNTFKQTFCFGCQKIDRRESTISFAQLSATRKRQNHLNVSVTYEHIPASQIENQLNGP